MLVSEGQGTLAPLHGKELLCYHVSSSLPPCRAALALTTPVSNSYKREPKLHQSAASVGSAIPPTSAEEQERGQSWRQGAAMAVLCQAHLAACRSPLCPIWQHWAEGRGRQGDVSLTWGTVQLLLCLAAALGLHLCPLAKEGETDVTCRAAQIQKQGGEDKARDFGQSTKQSHIPTTGNSQGTGPLLCPELRGTVYPPVVCIPSLPGLAPDTQQACAAGGLQARGPEGRL